MIGKSSSSLEPLTEKFTPSLALNLVAANGLDGQLPGNY